VRLLGVGRHWWPTAQLGTRGISTNGG
jgi:hypothetical protein